MLDFNTKEQRNFGAKSYFCLIFKEQQLRQRKAPPKGILKTDLSKIGERKAAKKIEEIIDDINEDLDLAQAEGAVGASKAVELPDEVFDEDGLERDPHRIATITISTEENGKIHTEIH